MIEDYEFNLQESLIAKDYFDFVVCCIKIIHHDFNYLEIDGTFLSNLSASYQPLLWFSLILL